MMKGIKTFVPTKQALLWLGMVLLIFSILAAGLWQDAFAEALEAAEPPAYEYATVEIFLENEGMNIYGVAYVPQTEAEAPCKHFSTSLAGSILFCIHGS